MKIKQNDFLFGFSSYPYLIDRVPNSLFLLFLFTAGPVRFMCRGLKVVPRNPDCSMKHRIVLSKYLTEFINYITFIPQPMKIRIDETSSLSLDVKRWTLATDRRCSISAESENAYTITNKNGWKADLSKTLFDSNELSVVGEFIELPAGLYNKLFVESTLANEGVEFNLMFNKVAAQIFAKGSLVLTEAEYFLLKPEMLQSLDPYMGAVQLSLGSIIQAWSTDDELHFPSFAGKADLFLIAVSGSVLTNRHSASFWCRSEGRVYSFASSKHPLEKGFSFYYKKFKKLETEATSFKIDLQDQALKSLLEEIKNIA
jgi:hypothetical protein